MTKEQKKQIKEVQKAWNTLCRISIGIVNCDITKYGLRNKYDLENVAGTHINIAMDHLKLAMYNFKLYSKYYEAKTLMMKKSMDRKNK